MSLPITIERVAYGGTRPLLLDATTAAPLALVGGKAAHLARLQGSGLRVPPWFSVTTELFVTLLEALPEELLVRLAALEAKDAAGIAATSRDLQEAFLAVEMPAAWRDAIGERCDQVFGPGSLVAVRSSAVGEDSVHSSQAGLMESHLFVPQDAVLRRVQETLASAFSAPCLLYKLLRGNDPRQIRAAVVIQEMVDSRASGVLFTVNPTTGDPGEIVIAAGYGLGEGVVADLVETDTIHVDRALGKIKHQDIPIKTKQVARDPGPGGGTRIEPLPSELREGPVLSSSLITQLVDGGESIEKLFGRAQDIEWAIDAAGRVFITQARPVTTRRRGRKRIFDNTNIVEGYPGVTTPLTFSYVRAAFETAFSKTAATYGASGPLLRRLRPLSRNALGLIDGRIYYNILNWYRSFASIPGLGLFRPSWEKAFGLSAEDRPNLAELSDRGDGRAAWWERILAYRRLGRNFLLLEKDLARFHRQVATVSQRFATRDLQAATADELFELYEEIMEQLLGEWDVPHTNDIYAFLFSHILGKLLKGWRLDDKNRLFNGLLCGESGMESVAPVRSLVALAEHVRHSEPLRQLFAEESDDQQLWRRIANAAAFSDFHDRALRHLELYGDRTVQELKLETPPLGERPQDFIAMLRNVLHHPVTVEAMEAREGTIRREAELTVRSALRWRPLRRLFLGYVLRQARTRIRTRENNRLIRTRVWGMVGRVFRALGKILAEEGHLDAPEDIFYLGVEEIEGFLRGTAISCSLRSLVAVRRDEYEHYKTTQPPRRVTTEGIVYGRPFIGDPEVDDGAEPTAILSGIGCSAGSVRGAAKIVLDPTVDTAIADQILIAPMTDPGWVFLMVAARGLVVERGGVLSHTAIIGRELGIPTVVGVEGATRRIRDGQEIEIDGEQGTVRILDA